MFSLAQVKVEAISAIREKSGTNLPPLVTLTYIYFLFHSLSGEKKVEDSVMVWCGQTVTWLPRSLTS
jgi:hypothetical protein